MIVSSIRDIDIPNIIYVFGSNQAGIHGKGSAVTAKSFFGATQGIGAGFVQRSYAIPTKDHKIQTLSLEKIHTNVEVFLKTAEMFDDYHFVVSKIGCGLAGHSEKNIISIFDDLFEKYHHLYLSNVTLPTSWQMELGLIEQTPYTIVAGSRTIQNVSEVKTILSQQIKTPNTIISGCAMGVDSIAIEWAKQEQVPFIRVPAPWDFFNGNKQTGIMRNWIMSIFATDCVCLWDGVSRGTKSMIDIAKIEQLSLNYVNINR